MRPRALAAAIDLFCFYRARLLPGVGQEHIILFTKSFFLDMFKLPRPDFCSDLLIARELPLG